MTISVVIEIESELIYASNEALKYEKSVFAV